MLFVLSTAIPNSSTPVILHCYVKLRFESERILRPLFCSRKRRISIFNFKSGKLIETCDKFSQNVGNQIQKTASKVRKLRTLSAAPFFQLCFFRLSKTNQSSLQIVVNLFQALVLHLRSSL